MKATKKAGFYLLLCAIGLAFIGPFLIVLTTGFKPGSQQVYTFPPQLLPIPPVLDWARHAWTSINFPHYLWNSVLLELLTVPPYLIISALAAYPLDRLRFRARQALFVLILATMFLPSEVMLVPRFLIISRLHLVDTFAGVVLPGLFSAFGIFLLRQAFESIPRELFDAARVDGCNELRIFWRVALPQVKPTLATLTIFGFISVWNSFVWPLVVLNSDTKYPLSLGLAYLAGTFGDDPRSLAAGTVMAVLPVVAFFIAMQRHFVEGMKGAVKG
jgi:putative chitobiose transport system permease protein